MAALGTGSLTLADIAKTLDPNGAQARIIELLNQTNDLLTDMTWMEGNLPTGHRTTVRTQLPTVAARLLNAGTSPSKSHSTQIDEQCALFDAWSQIDVKIAELSGNPSAARLSEARAFLEAMNQKIAATLIYGAATTPSEFVGFAARTASLSGSNSDQVISASGSGSDNTSIYLVAWDPETVCGIYPKGSVAGLNHEDLGVDTVENAGGVTGALMRAYRDHWTWDCGVAVKDYRYLLRICNIDVSDLAGGSPADLIDKMEEAQEKLPNRLGRSVFYMNRTVRRFLRKQYRTDVSSGGGLTYETVSGKTVTMFGDTPVRIVDAILNTEAAVA